MSLAGETISIGGAEYYFSKPIAEDPTTHLMLNVRSRMGVLVAKVHPPNTEAFGPTDSAFLHGEDETLEVCPNRLIPPARDTEPWWGDMRAAAAIIDEGQELERARPFLERILAEYPDHCLALYRLAQVDADADDLPSALQHMNRLVEVEPNHEGYRRQQVWLLSNRVAYRYGFKEALEGYISRFPRSRECDEAAVQAFLEQGKPEQAKWLLDFRASNARPATLKDKLKGLAASPTDSAQLQTLVDDAMERKQQAAVLAQQAREVSDADIDGACRLLDAAVDVFPENAETRANLGLCLAKLGRYEDAIEHLKAASSTIPEPGRTSCFANLLFCMMRLGRHEAVDQLEHFLAHLLDGEPDRVAVDLPGVGSWVHVAQQSVSEERPATALRIIDSAIASRKALGQAIPAGTLRIRALYARAAELI